jgi:DNA primase
VASRYIDFAYVKENASFEQVIACYNLKLGSGPERAVLRPFHRERRPSCKIELERKIFHCFGCEKKGNILEFVARMEGDEDDLGTAAQKIAAVCGIATAAPRPPAGQRPAGEHRRKGAISENTSTRRPRVAKAWAEPAEDGSVEGRLTNRRFDGVAEPANPPLIFALKLEPGHPYLNDRGLSPEIIAEFGLGYCSRGVMAGCICLPIHNERGELVAYAGRWPGDDPPEGQERYKLPAKFQKSRVLFNLHRVAIGEHIVLVEGYWSVFRLHALGIPVAALMGWSVSAEQVALLRERGARFVTLLLDGDDTGRKARERVLPALASAFFVRAPLLPDGQKPDTIGEAQLRQLVSLP